MSCLFYFIPISMNIEKAVSAIQNDVVAGLPGLTNHSRFSLEQIEDDLIEERLAVIKQYASSMILPIRELLVSIDCIPVDCKELSGCCTSLGIKPSLHFEIPQVITDFGVDGINYIGSVDMESSFKVYTSNLFRRHKNRKRGADKPYVWIKTTPNTNGMFDGYVFNTPMLKVLTAVIAPKDPRQLDQYTCCGGYQFDSKSFLDSEVRKRLTERYIRYYRQMATAHTPNTQTAT